MDKTIANEIYFKNLLKNNKIEKLRAKRKLSELLIEELETDIYEENKKNKDEEENILSLKTPIFLNHVASPDISNEYGSQFLAGRAFNKPNKRSILNSKRNLIDLLDESQIQVKTPEKSQRITHIIEDTVDEHSIESPKMLKRIQVVNKSKQPIPQRYDIDNILNDKTLQINTETEKVFRNLNQISNRNNYLLNEIENELECEKITEQMNNTNSNLEKLSESASSLSLNESHELTNNDKINQFINYKRAIENLIDENINESHLNSLLKNINEDLNTTSKLNHTTNSNNITGTEWLKEKLVDETLNKTDFLNRTTVDTINCNLFLNENDLKKKKAKLVKNGYAERLQKIILRQASSINFIRHNMNKEKSQFKSVKNSIIAVPFYKQSSFNRQFSLLYAFNYSKTQLDEFELNQNEQCIYILISNDLIESYKLFDADLKPLYYIKLYPPWKRMVLKESNISIYFCTDLIEVIEIEAVLLKQIPTINSHVILVELNDLKCTECNNENSLECKLNIFDVKNYMIELKRSISKDRLNSNRFLLKENNKHLTTFHNTQNYLFFTQTDAEYYVNPNDPDTQYMRVNSILDALENIGYYGFITFRATVQRIGIVRNHFISSTATTSSTTQISHTFIDNPLKKHILISDKFGMFALIIFPYEFNSIEESNKYQFNSVKFLEKQILSLKENNLLYDQVRYLWEEMNLKRKKDSKSTLKTSPKSIYVFEFVNEMRSSLDCLGPSKKYLPLKDFESLEAAYNEINETNILFFDLNNVIPIKLFQHEKGYFLFIMIMDDYEIQPVHLETFDHFLDLDLIEKLSHNYIPIENSYLFKNIQITKTGDKKFEMNSNCYSYSETISRNGTLQIEQIQNQFKYLNSQAVELYSFVKIVGKVMDICEDMCCFEFICSRCKVDLNSSINSDSSIEQANKFTCESCGFNNEKPEINVKMQVVLNCSNTSLIVKINLHYKTIEHLLPLNTILHNNEGFDISLVMDKTIGPLNAFIYKLNDTELYADELYFD